MTDVFELVLVFFSKTFGLPKEWFVFPTIIVYFLIPLSAMIYMWYEFLDKKLRIFRSSSTNLGISTILAIMSTPIIGAFGPGATTAISAGGTVLVMGNLNFLRIAGSILIAILIGTVYPWLINFFANMIMV